MRATASAPSVASAARTVAGSVAAFFAAESSESESPEPSSSPRGGSSFFARDRAWGFSRSSSEDSYSSEDSSEDSYSLEDSSARASPGLGASAGSHDAGSVRGRQHDVHAVTRTLHALPHMRQRFSAQSAGARPGKRGEAHLRDRGEASRHEQRRVVASSF